MYLFERHQMKDIMRGSQNGDAAPGAQETEGKDGNAMIPLEDPDRENSMPERYSPFRQERFPAGGLKSVRRLKELQYDPIKELVKLYNKLTAEDKYHEDVREGRRLDADGDPVRYRVQAHVSVKEQMIRVAESLLRYGYGRVPETMQIEGDMSPLVINLTNGASLTVSEGDK